MGSESITVPTPKDIQIDAALFTSLKDKVVVLTGGSSGIGLATATFLHDRGAKVVQGDLQPAPDGTPSDIVFKTTDVTVWSDLRDLFDEAKEKFGRIDHVFANAGVGGISTYASGDEFDEDGKLKEPNHVAVHVNLVAVMNTVKLAIHHMKNQPEGGSIVLTGSASSFLPFQVPDYTSSKHGVLGFMRAVAYELSPHLPIRINTIAPAWTATGLAPEAMLKSRKLNYQKPEAVAASVALLMSDTSRNKQVIYSYTGRYTDLEPSLVKAAVSLLPETLSPRDD